MTDYFGEMPQDFNYWNETHGINPKDQDDFQFGDREKNPTYESRVISDQLRREGRK